MKLGSALVLALVLIQTTGCSIYMAATQPEKKDLSVLNQGTPRTHVIAECGLPLHTEEVAGRKTDIYVFTQGYSTGAKASRAFFHTAADIFTLGLWEIVGTPFEAVVDGTEVKIKILYDDQEQIEQIEVIEGDRKLKDVDSIATTDKSPKGPTAVATTPESVPAEPLTAATDREEPLGPANPWTGVWAVRSTIDEKWSWHIDQQGNQVVSAPDDDYPLNGEVEGDQLSGWLKQTSGSDLALKLNLAPDYQKFEGQFTNGEVTGYLTGEKIE